MLLHIIRFDDALYILERITGDVQSQLHHAAVPVPKHKNPFTSSKHATLFKECLMECLEEDIVPAGFAVKSEEWGQDGYPTFEILKSGRRGTKELRVALPIEEWLPRAEIWVQALTVLNSILETVGN